MITKTGADPFGAFVRRALAGYGVDDRFVGESAGLQTPLAFCEIFPPDDFPLYFYRSPKAPDLDIAPGELDLDAIAAARIFWVTVTGLCAEPSRAATMTALEARGRTGSRVLDLDYRPMFWASPERPVPGRAQALEYATVAVGNLDECEIAVGVRDPQEAATALLDHGVELAVVKQGPHGRAGGRRSDEREEVPPVPVEVVNGLGAGDAFGGALCHGLLAGLGRWSEISFANAAGASRVPAGLLDAMPTPRYRS